MFAWIALLPALSPAASAASEVGSEKPIGIGVEAGNAAYANLSAKFWLSDKAGISAHAGTLFVYHEVGARFEADFVEWSFDWADLPMWWWVGADVGLYSNAGYSAVQVGPSGGIGAALQFADFPGEVFATTGLGVYPANYCSGLGSGGLCVIQPRGTAGFRYYF
ncbi:MAG: hypothetical protein R3F59_31040 [Myxococcota bacterium]